MRSRFGEPIQTQMSRRARREAGFVLEVLLAPEQRRASLREDAAQGLRKEPKMLPAKWLYDDRGVALFEEISRLDEYYLTAAETALLQAHANEIAEVSRAEMLVDLGAGRCTKARVLVDALRDHAPVRTFVPFDMSASALRGAGPALVRDYPGLAVHGLAGDLDRHLRFVPGGGRRLVALLGSTLGNFVGEARMALLRELRGTMRDGDFLLLGTDMVKDVARMERAYNDPAGLTAAFNLNLLRILNRELGANFVVDRFEHVASWEPEPEAVTLRLRSRSEQDVEIFDLETRAHFAAGEQLVTEHCTKFRRDRLTRELAEAGFDPLAWWTDEAGEYAVSMWTANGRDRPS